MRLALGLTQRELADIVGAHAMTISRWERGLAEPKGHQSRIFEVLEIAAARGTPLPPGVDRTDSMRVLAHWISRAYEDADVDLASLSATNRLPGTVVNLTRGEVMSKVVIEVAPQVRIGSVITTDSLDRLRITVGSRATAVIKATEVMVGAGGIR